MNFDINTLDMGEAIARSGQPTPALECLCASYRQVVGWDSFTVTLFKQPTEGGQGIVSGYRMYSTMMETHPAVVEVSFGSTAWRDAMIFHRRILVMDNIEQYKNYYDASDWLREAGFQSAINIPVILNDIAVGSINMMSKSENYFNNKRVSHAKTLMAVSALTLMLCGQYQDVLAGL